VIVVSNIKIKSIPILLISFLVAMYIWLWVSNKERTESLNSRELNCEHIKKD